jgi:hypothetical protein
MSNTFYTEVSNLNTLVKNIYEKEADRVEKRKQGINDMMVSQKRLISLNQSYTSKMKKYGYMISIIAFALVIIIMIIHFRYLLPSLLADLGIVIAIAGAIIWAYLIYVDIQNRDKIDFDELAIDSSSLVNPANIDKQNTDAGNEGDISALSSNAALGAGCIGSACCELPAWSSVTADNTKIGKSYFNSKTKKCEIVPQWVVPSGKTTMDEP